MARCCTCLKRAVKKAIKPLCRRTKPPAARAGKRKDRRAAMMKAIRGI